MDIGPCIRETQENLVKNYPNTKISQYKNKTEISNFYVTDNKQSKKKELGGIHIYNSRKKKYLVNSSVLQHKEQLKHLRTVKVSTSMMTDDYLG